MLFTLPLFVQSARLELEVESLKTQLAQCKVRPQRPGAGDRRAAADRVMWLVLQVSDSRSQQLLQEAQKSAKSSKLRVQVT